MYSVRSNDLLAPIVKAIQELEAKNSVQNKLILELISRIDVLEKKGYE